MSIYRRSRHVVFDAMSCAGMLDSQLRSPGSNALRYHFKARAFSFFPRHPSSLRRMSTWLSTVVEMYTVIFLPIPRHVHTRSFLFQLIDQLRDLPILLRHLVGEFFSLHGLVLMFRVRLIICCVMAFIYIASPLDIIPESVFGILGLLDDIFVIVLLAVYASVLYRRYVADQAMDDA